LIGEDVLIGHLAMVHGCILHDRAFVGLGAIVMDGCEIEGDAMLAAGAMLTPGKRIGSGQLWAGRPAKYVRDLSESDLVGMRAGVANYVELARRHAAALRGD
jgi:carbonic anhydrase/acetyltransferase-like protein (isoleucine patch superfamily)